MKNNIRSFLLSSIILLTSCVDNEKTHRKEVIEQNKALSNALITKWDALKLSDSIREFTYWYQESLIEHKKPFAIIGKIADIYKSEKSYILKVILNGNRNKYIANIIVDSLKMARLKDDIGEFRIVKGCFIVNPVKIKSKSPSLSVDFEPGSQPDQDGDGGEDSYITIGDMGIDKIMTFSGNLIDYSIIEK